MFDAGDTDGDNFLTVKEFQDLVINVGGIASVLKRLGWFTQSGADESKEEYSKRLAEKKAIFDDIIAEIKDHFGGAVVLEQFTYLMTRFITINN